MLFEVLILDRQDCVVEHLGKLIILRDDTTLQGKRPKRAALIVVEYGVRDRAIVTEVVNLWKVNGIHQGQPAQRPYTRRYPDQQREYAPSAPYPSLGDFSLAHKCVRDLLELTSH